MRFAVALALVAVACAVMPDRAAGGVALGAAGGWIKPDGRLADYRWDARPAGAWGAEARVEHDAWGAGFRVLRGRSTQDVGGSGAAARAAVHTTRLELVGRRRVTRRFGQELFVTLNAGRMRLGYDPDRVTLDVAGSGPVTVDLAPVHGWIAGGGVAIERAVSRRFVAGIAADGGRYAFDTAHRAGDGIVLERSAFTDWGARFTLAWRSAPN